MERAMTGGRRAPSPPALHALQGALPCRARGVWREEAPRRPADQERAAAGRPPGALSRAGPADAGEEARPADPPGVRTARAIPRTARRDPARARRGLSLARHRADAHGRADAA